MAGSAHGVGTEARALPAALTMTSAPAVVSMAALAAREAHGGLVLPAAAASVEAALAVWAAAPVLAEPGAAAAALVEDVRGLNEQFGTPQSLSAANIPHDDFYNNMHGMTEKILRDITTAVNPVKVGPADVEMLLGDIYEGRNPLG